VRTAKVEVTGSGDSAEERAGAELEEEPVCFFPIGGAEGTEGKKSTTSSTPNVGANDQKGRGKLRAWTRCYLSPRGGSRAQENKKANTGLKSRQSGKNSKHCAQKKETGEEPVDSKKLSRQ